MVASSGATVAVSVSEPPSTSESVVLSSVTPVTETVSAVRYPGSDAPLSMRAYSLSVFELSNTVPAPPLRFMQSVNIKPESVTCSVFHLSETVIILRFEQLPNIPSIFVTFEVSKDERSSEGRAEQYANMVFISVTLEVSKPETSRDSSAEHRVNIISMRVTFEVSKFEISSAVSAVQ